LSQLIAVDWPGRPDACGSVLLAVVSQVDCAAAGVSGSLEAVRADRLFGKGGSWVSLG
jgi:hypothetical protein